MNDKTPPDTIGNVSEWTRMLWEAEAKYTATVGSRLKFGLPLSSAKPRQRKVKVEKLRTAKARLMDVTSIC